MDKKVLRVCYATSSLGRGGAEKQLYLILKHHDPTLLKPHVLTFADGPWRQEIEKLGVAVTILTRASRFARFVSTLNFLRKTRPDVLHCFGGTAGFLVRPAAIILRTPIVIASERYAVETKGRLKLLIEKLLGYFTTFIVCNAEHSAIFYQENRIVPRSKIRVIKNGIEITESEPWLPPAAPCIGYLANLRDGKNHEFLVHALKVLKTRFPTIRLLLAGSGYRQPLISQLARSLGIEDSVVLLGSIEDRSWFFSQISVYCHVSLYEGIPNAVMEAMARGIPCVVSDIAGNRELITHDLTGLLVSPTSTVELTDAVTTLLSSREQGLAYGTAARRVIEDSFGVSRMVNETFKLYSK